MSKRKFVREIKAKELKDINPSDVIYLAMKDGSIVLITDDDEETIEYDDIKLDTSFKRRHKYYNKRKDKNDDYSLYTFETDKKNRTTIYSNNTIDYNTRNNSTTHTTLNAVKNNSKRTPEFEKQKFMVNERINRNINQNNSNIKIKNEILDKSFDYRKNHKNNIGYHEIEYYNNQNKSFDSYNIRSNYHDRPKSSINHHNYGINTNRNRRQNYISNDDDQKNFPNLINISNISMDSRISNHKKYNDHIKTNENNYIIMNSLTRKNKDKERSKSYINRNQNNANNFFVEKKEVQIMGKIVNDKHSYRNVEHNHPDALFDPNCRYCQILAKENKLSYSNIKSESIYNNCSFLASFGDGEIKNLTKRKEYSNGGY